MLDVAREQSPSTDWLIQVLKRSESAGYGAVGLYLEHRFAYPSAPWAAGPGALSPEAVREAIRSAPGVRLIPFLNTLGHMEGFIRSEGGKWLAEGASTGSQQACPSNPRVVEFARGLIADAMDAFSDEWVHLGGDETWQLGQCAECSQRAEKIGKAGIYGEFYGPLCEWVLDRGRRPCLWADMLIEHPDAIRYIPKQTILFDWHYDKSPVESASQFREMGFDVVCCPAVHTFDSAWCFLDQTQENVDEHAAAAIETDSLGVLVTTWEYSYFTNYESTLPVIYACGRRLSSGADWSDAIRAEGGEEYWKAAEILGNQIPSLSPFLQKRTWRKFRNALIFGQNPFYLWLDWGEEACGSVGDDVIRLCMQVEDLLPEEHPLRFPARLYRSGVEWVRVVRDAHDQYRAGDLAAARYTLEQGCSWLEGLRPDLERIAAGGGSSADVRRLRMLVEKVRNVSAKIGEVEATHQGVAHLPSFERLVHDAYVVGDQAAWRTGQFR